jgi:hypothetical protein
LGGEADAVSEPAPTYVLKLRSNERDDKAAIRGLRWLLKRALRDFGLRCVGIATELIDDNA